MQYEQKWIKKEWNKDWDKETLEEWLREPKVLPSQVLDYNGKT